MRVSTIQTRPPKNPTATWTPSGEKSSKAQVGSGSLPVRITDPDRQARKQGPTVEPGHRGGSQGVVWSHDEGRPAVGGQGHARDRSVQLHRLPAADIVEAFSSATLPVRSLTAIVWPPLA